MARFEHMEEMVVGLYERGLGGDPKDKILDIGVSKILKSGIWSPYLVNFRPALSVDNRSTVSVPKQEQSKSWLLESFCTPLDELKAAQRFDHIYGPPETGTPLAAAVSGIGGYSLLWRRVEAKPGYGSHQMLEGVYYPGQEVCEVDDVVTLGETKKSEAEFLGSIGLSTNTLVVGVDREQGGRQAMEAEGWVVEAAMRATEIFEILAEAKYLNDAEFDFLMDYTRNPAPLTEPADHPWRAQ